MRYIPRSVLWLCLMMMTASFGLTSDNQQPVTIEADKAYFDHTQGLSIYEGHVSAIQGASQLSADKVIAYTDNHQKLKLLIATGSPAHYQTQPNHKPLILTHADTIKYAPLEQTVELLGTAHAEQGQNKIDGPHLIYNMAQQSLSSFSLPAGRTRIVIMPQTILKGPPSHEHT